MGFDRLCRTDHGTGPSRHRSTGQRLGTPDSREAPRPALQSHRRRPPGAPQCRRADRRRLPGDRSIQSRARLPRHRGPPRIARRGGLRDGPPNLQPLRRIARGGPRRVRFGRRPAHRSAGHRRPLLHLPRDRRVTDARRHARGQARHRARPPRPDRRPRRPGQRPRAGGEPRLGVGRIPADPDASRDDGRETCRTTRRGCRG